MEGCDEVNCESGEREEDMGKHKQHHHDRSTCNFVAATRHAADRIDLAAVCSEVGLVEFDCYPYVASRCDYQGYWKCLKNSRLLKSIYMVVFIL